MDKLKMHSPNLVDSNIEKIAALFPNCVTETQGENGELKKAIDFDLLKQELSQVLVEGEQERYRLDWVGKKEAILTANAPIAKTLRPCRDESVNFDSTENLFIEGDNLEALKLLQENYLGKVKMIYIDPPYNTGNDFIYEDDFAESTDEFFERSNQTDDEGNKLVANTDSNGRFHSDWLSMMYSRLKLARNLLAEDGFIFINIDDTEQSNLRKLCDEIYGQANFIANIAWQHSMQSKNDEKFFSRNYNHLIVYRKAFSNTIFRLPRTEQDNKNYSNPDNDPKGLWRAGDFRSPNLRNTLKFKIQTPNGGFIEPPENGWRWSEESIKQKIRSGEIIFSQDQTKIIRKIYLIDQEGRVPENLWSGDDAGTTRQANSELKEIFGGEVVFDTPKPTKLIQRIMKLLKDEKDYIILDFFAGSSTTADAVMQLNAEDGGNRKFIMVQLPEQTDEKSEAYKAGYANIAEISKERIRRAGKKILDDNAGKESIENLDIGFRVLKIDSSNMKDVYYTPDALKQADMLDLASNIKEDRTADDLLFQVMLDWGLEISLPIERKTVAGKEVFYVAGNSLVACFDDLTFDVIDEVAKDHPLRFVSAEKAIHLDHDKTNIKERFKQLSPDTEVKFL
ncbi:TPA: site-specific DNA-methyltransferase [Acinetobacter baumannii]|uniref:site-specific DNA-methyltransferase n=1 Tax=Acinetobacter baumannii TaxID=470 RepID=UPI0026F183D3|nr:site-specific DNA-methyltransferase [Acinetobacter baumannii]HEE5795302.1 site-specific DNA-methyltransferase [Acinetobacter baumannii]